MLHFFQGSKLQMHCSTPEHTRGSQDGTTTPLLTGNEAASVMDKLKCSLLPEMKGEWLVGLLFLQCQCLVCKWHDILGNPGCHIVCLHHPNRRRFAVVPLDEIVDVCVYMKFTDSDLGYASHFANHIERD